MKSSICILLLTNRSSSSFAEEVTNVPLRTRTRFFLWLHQHGAWSDSALAPASTCLYFCTRVYDMCDTRGAEGTEHHSTVCRICYQHIQGTDEQINTFIRLKCALLPYNKNVWKVSWNLSELAWNTCILNSIPLFYFIIYIVLKIFHKHQLIFTEKKKCRKKNI